MSTETKILISIVGAIVIVDMLLLYFVHKKTKRLDRIIDIHDEWYLSKIDDR